MRYQQSMYSETSDKGHSKCILIHTLYKITSERGQTSQQRTHQTYSSIHTLYKITSERGRLLYKGQWVPLFGGFKGVSTRQRQGEGMQLCIEGEMLAVTKFKSHNDAV